MRLRHLTSKRLISRFLSGAEAFDGGDTVALILGLIIGISGILACLGAYARRKGMA